MCSRMLRLLMRSGEDCLVAMSPFQGDDGFFRDDCDLSDQERGAETSGNQRRFSSDSGAALSRRRSLPVPMTVRATPRNPTPFVKDLRCERSVRTPLSDGDLCAESDDCRDGLYCKIRDSARSVFLEGNSATLMSNARAVTAASSRRSAWRSANKSNSPDLRPETSCLDCPA